MFIYVVLSCDRPTAGHAVPTLPIYHPLQADWSPAAYAALVRFALKRVGGPKGMLASAAPLALPAPGAAGLLGGTTAEEAR